MGSIPSFFVKDMGRARHWAHSAYRWEAKRAQATKLGELHLLPTIDAQLELCQKMEKQWCNLPAT